MSHIEIYYKLSNIAPTFLPTYLPTAKIYGKLKSVRVRTTENV